MPNYTAAFKIPHLQKRRMYRGFTSYCNSWYISFYNKPLYDDASGHKIFWKRVTLMEKNIEEYSTKQLKSAIKYFLREKDLPYDEHPMKETLFGCEHVILLFLKYRYLFNKNIDIPIKECCQTEMLQQLSLLETLEDSTATMVPTQSFQTTPTPNNLCCVCLGETSTHVMIPCGHLCLCNACLPSVENTGRCPICRIQINSTILIYRS